MLGVDREYTRRHREIACREAAFAELVELAQEMADKLDRFAPLSSHDVRARLKTLLARL